MVALRVALPAGRGVDLPARVRGPCIAGRPAPASAGRGGNTSTNTRSTRDVVTTAKSSSGGELDSVAASVDEFLERPRSEEETLALKRKKQAEAWLGWEVVGLTHWDGSQEEDALLHDGTPQRPRYPAYVPGAKQNNIWRDDWLRPLTDTENLRQRLLMAEEDAMRLQEEEAKANSYDSKKAVQFAGILFGAPIVTAAAARLILIDPVTSHLLEANPGAFKMSYMQEVEGAHEVHQEEARMKMQISLGRAPALNDEEMTEHLREFAQEVKEETRGHNKQGLGNLCQDTLTGALIFGILTTDNKGRTKLFSVTDRAVSGVSDTGKAFVIILVADIVMGYHSEEGWTALINLLSEHWNMEPERNVVYLFVSFVPVLLDALFKLYLFQGFKAQNPSSAITLEAMDRH